MGDRRKGRELALQGLYQRDITGNQSPASIEAFVRHFHAGEEANAFALRLVHGVIEHAEQIDALIAEACENWRFERLSKIDLNVMRLATYELLASSDVPFNVVINEAIEIARRFGAEESPVFVNGVLDAIAERVGAKSREPASENNGRALPTRGN